MKGFIYLPVPKEFHSLYPPNGRLAGDDDTEPHVTLVYFPVLSKENIEKVNTICKKLGAETKPVATKFGKTFSFPATSDGLIPWVAEIESDDLHELHDLILQEIAKSGMNFKEKFPIYRPHTTLEYMQPGDKSNAKLPPHDFFLTEIIFHTKPDNTEEERDDKEKVRED